MSKMVTIPENHKPFIVNINNREYIYRGGETVEVPDDVAEVIEDAIALEPKPQKNISKIGQLTDGSLTEITTSDLRGIETIASYAFYQRPNLHSIEMPNEVKSIGAYTFAYCLGITDIEIPYSVTIINYRAFTGCNSLKTLTFAENSKIQVISDNAFADCTSLERVVLKSKIPPSISGNTFSNVPTTCVFEVPSESLEAYKIAANWSAFANQIVAIEE